VFYDLSHRKEPSFFSPVTVNMIPYDHNKVSQKPKSIKSYFVFLPFLKGNTAVEAPTANFIKITEAQVLEQKDKAKNENKWRRELNKLLSGEDREESYKPVVVI